MSVTKERNSDLDLKSPPVVACRLMELYYSDYDNEEIVQIVQIDPALTAKILSVCNTAASGISDPVGSLPQAISLIGFGPLINLVWKLSIGGTLQRPADLYGIPENGLWRHSVTTAVAAQELSRIHPDPPEPEDVAFTAGLLHDIGKIVINQSYNLSPNGLRDLLKKNGVSIVEAEKTLNRLDHAAVGADILRQWKLPEILIEAIARHHDPPADTVALSSIIHLGNACAHMMGASYGYQSLSNPIETESPTTLGFGADAMERAMIGVQLRSEEIENFISSQ